MSTLEPDADLGQRYFGKVVLGVVPAKESSPTPATQFFFQDQLGVHIEGLRQRVRLPFMLRVFNRDSARLIAEVRSEQQQPSGTAATPTGSATTTRAEVIAHMAGIPTTAMPPATASASEFEPARFWSSYVWYHEGSEEPGRYRLELYANGTLTHSFDYDVRMVPVAAPTAMKPEPAVARTPAATPPTASTTQIGGIPAGLDVRLNDGRIFVADASGVIWTTEPQRKSFNRSLDLDRLPVDLAVDQTTGYIFVSARNAPAVVVLDASGRVLRTIDMPATPGDIQLDPELGLLFVLLPEKQAVGVVDVRGGRGLQTINDLPQVTSMALDPMRHVLYLSHLAGQVSVIDIPSSQVVARISASGVGLSNIATARGLAFAVNPVSHELSVIDARSQTANRYRFDSATETIEPAAIAAAEDSGSVYVLASKPNVVLRIDPTDGSELGRVQLPERSSRLGTKVTGQADVQGQRARMTLNRLDETLYLTHPEAGTLTVVAADQFPTLARAIPSIDSGEFAVDGTIAGLLRPSTARRAE
jgi:hypothetical protein